ncbi:MAG: MFS transporter [Novosphingobium sp.]|nr:MFS transporter [Novosphingobium sp.]
MKPGTWTSILGLYLFGVCGGATVSKLIPLAGDLEAKFGLTGASFGWLVALVALPAATFAIPSGIVVDRWGSKRVLLAAGIAGVLANALYVVAESMTIIYFARVLEGLAIVHVYTAGPAMLMATTQGDRRTRAMTLWSTYAPVGTAIGLGVGGLFAESQGWKQGFTVHASLFALATILGLFQPSIVTSGKVARSLADRIAELFSAFGRPQLAALGIAFLMAISMGVGVNMTLPLYVSQVHAMATGDASAMVASVTFTMVLGAALAGLALPKLRRPQSLFPFIALAGLGTGALCFVPSLSVEARYATMIAWFAVSGASLATITASLPMAADPSRPGSAAALFNLAGALAALLNPPLWLGILGTGGWLPFIGLLAGGWTIALVAFLLIPQLAGRDQPTAFGAA